MKKTNIIFIGECIIIVLLLAILGILLKNDNKNSLAKETTIESEMIEEETDGSVGEEDIAIIGSSSIENVSDVVESPSDSVVEQESTSSDSMPETGSLSFNSISANQASPEPENIIQDGKFLSGKNIVVFGDSIWSAARGQDGISEYIEQETGATVYNCAIGGTTAALVEGDEALEDWTSNSFNGMMYVTRGLLSRGRILEEDSAVYEIVKQVDLDEMDYIVISYGLNDFFCNVPIYPEAYYQVTSYVGALRNGISKFIKYYPQAKVIVVSPTYTKMFEGERTFEIGDYVEAARSVASEMGVEFLDMFHVLGNSPEARTKHLGDGVHMSAEGRKVYSNAVIEFLEQLEAENVE